MSLSAAEEVKKKLSGVAGGNITLPDALLEFGFLSVGVKNIALVKDRKLQFVEEIYQNKLHWNRNSGLFTITELQKNDSGIYTIDSKRERVFISSYNLTVYDPAPTPAVETQTVSSDSCWLICSVDKQASLLWIKDQDILNQSRSALSLPVTVRKEDRGSSYRCVAANPAENKTLHVNVTTSCALSRAGSGDNHRDYRTVILVAIVLLLIAAALTSCIKLKLPEKQSIRPKQGVLRSSSSSSLAAQPGCFRTCELLGSIQKVMPNNTL
ncbi:CD48 antigen-like [Anableps anableps]